MALIINHLSMSLKFWYILLTITCLGLLTGRCSAQGKPSAALTLDLHQVKYADLLKEIEKQTGYRFF
jgi:hypothetical protein